MAAKTLCKFYAQGYCRYGDKCFYSHSAGGQSPAFGGGGGAFFGGQTKNPFKLDNRYSSLNSSGSSRALFGGSEPQQTNNDVISNLCTEIQTWAQSGMWLFSSFYTSKESNCKLPGFDDFSPEELRHEAYQENPKHHLQVNYKSKERQLANDVRMKMEKLKNPDAQTKQQLLAFIKQGPTSAGQSPSAFGGAVSPQPTSTTPGNRNAEESLAAIGNEVSTWERSGMWLLSEYCATKESPTVPGFKDISFEELRFEAYSENPKPHLQINYKLKEREIMNEARMRIGQLRNPDPGTKQQLLAFLAKTPGKEVSSTSGQAQTGLFGGAASSAQKSLFVGSQSVKPSVFGGSAVFGASPAQSAFPTTSATSPFGNSTFGGTNNSGSLFGKPAVVAQTGSTGGLFGKAAAQGTTFGQNQSATSVFGGAATNSAANPSVFGSTSSPSVFGGAQPTSAGLFGNAAAANTASTGLFGKPAQAPSTGLFGKPADPTPGATSGLFGKTVQADSTSTGLFGKPADSPSAGLFGKPAESTGLFGKTDSASAATGLFGKPVQESGLFGKPASTGLFANQTDTAGLGDNNNSTETQQASLAGHDKSLPLYTPLQELSEAERTQFEAAEFTIGRIPTRPPAKEHV